ncbi:MAG: hypothetical protein J0J04_08260 [Microbacterium sp.]|uniref:hypothetical protein n=1 Tax=Microbacterium sp. TaxID=51671 RepID=UPI001ACDC589|nr:hypothetical protein [Microbacterium sp.]MBN9214794.1 hypothetical protein [Microbacterium sp.]
MSELYEQGTNQVDVTNKPVAALLDEGVIGRWARLFAARYRTPARADEFSARIVGAIAEEPVLARGIISSEEDLDAVFQYARATVEAYVGLSVFTVSGSVRESARREALRSASSRSATSHCATHRVLSPQRVA